MDVTDNRKRCCASLVCAYRSHDIQHKACDVYHSGYQSAEKRYYSKYASYQTRKVDHQRLIQMVPDERVILVAQYISSKETYPCKVRHSRYKISVHFLSPSHRGERRPFQKVMQPLLQWIIIDYLHAEM